MSSILPPELRVRGRESRGGGTRPRLEPRELLAHGRCPAQSQQAGREVRAPPSQAAGWRLPLETGKASESSPRLLQSRGWAERQPPTCGGEGRGEWRQGLGEADTEVNLPAVLCKTPLSVQCSWHKTRNSHSHSLAHSSPPPQGCRLQRPKQLPYHHSNLALWLPR